MQYLSHALQILVPAAVGQPPQIGELARRAVAEHLGDDHDLALLQAGNNGVSAAHQAADGPLLRPSEQRRARLQIKALAAGKRLYARKPRAMAARIGRSCAARRS